jgi:thioredoxin 2
VQAAQPVLIQEKRGTIVTHVLDERGVVMSCPACGRNNRLAYTSLDKRTRCGHCRATIPPPAVPLEARSAAAFDAAAAASALPLVVDFWAPWCGPCRMVAPELEKVARANAGRWLVVKVNTDEQAELGARYRIRSIPTLAVVHRGRELARESGVRPAPEIERFVAAAEGNSARRAS